MYSTKLANSIIGASPKGQKACDSAWFNTTARERTGTKDTNDKKQNVQSVSVPQGKLQGHAQ